MRLLAIDPGNKQSGYVLFEHKPFELLEAGDVPNPELRKIIRRVQPHCNYMAIEEPTVIGQKFMQTDVMEAAVETGRFIQCFGLDLATIRLYRRNVLLTLFGRVNVQKADTQVKALIRLNFGEVGSPKKPGPLIKLRGLNHAWQALGCGLAALEQEVSF